MADQSPTRRPFQFHMRTLFVLVTLIAAASWVFADRQRLIRERDDAVESQQAMQKKFDESMKELLERRDHLILYRATLDEEQRRPAIRSQIVTVKGGELARKQDTPCTSR